MRLRDLDQVLRIERLSFSSPWSRAAFLSELLENDRARYIVARIGDQVVGYTGMWIVIDEGHITNVAVHPHWRNRGIATQLLGALEEIARANGVRRMTLEVRKSNVVAHTLYEKLGFRDAGIRRAYYRDNNEDAIIMWKEL
ncbi:MAG: ribosomal protein S18-alanine N-acetyltransferase [Limnochordales bacterium]|nr:ribosomal protein S18-alanine N-acetyltransferase [Limnochordales bacterium]